MTRVGKWNGKGRIVQMTAVVPHDTNAVQFDVLYVGTGGDVELRARDSASAIVLKNVGSGEYILANVNLVKSALTTAADIVGCQVQI